MFSTIEHKIRFDRGEVEVTGEVANNVGGIHHSLCATTIACSHSLGGECRTWEVVRGNSISSLVLCEKEASCRGHVSCHLYFLQWRAVYHTIHRLPRRRIVEVSLRRAVSGGCVCRDCSGSDEGGSWTAPASTKMLFCRATSISSVDRYYRHQT